MAKLSHNTIARAIYLASKNKTGADMHMYIKNVVKFLFQKKLLSKSEYILDKMQKLEDKESGLIQTKVYTAKKLDENTKKELSTILTKKHNAKRVSFTEIVDSNLVGGLKVEVDDEIIDLTIFNKLQKLQAHLTR